MRKADLLGLFFAGDEVHLNLFGDDGGLRVRPWSVVSRHTKFGQSLPFGNLFGNQLLLHLVRTYNLDLFVCFLIGSELSCDLVVAHPLQKVKD